MFSLGLPSTPSNDVWLSNNLPPGSKVGVDPSLIPYETFKSLQTQLSNNGHSLLPISVNLIDVIWKDKPARPSSYITPLPIKYTGKPGVVECVAGGSESDSVYLITF